MNNLFRPITAKIFFCGELQTVKGYVAQNIFLCKGDSLTEKTPWYAFNYSTGKILKDKTYTSRLSAFLDNNSVTVQDKGRPEYGKQYALTGGTKDKCIANGNTWEESEVRDATRFNCWPRFVNLYRQVHGSNKDLDKPFIRNMNENQLQTAISNMQGLLNAPSYCGHCGGKMKDGMCDAPLSVAD